jgi:hypothetical protein
MAYNSFLLTVPDPIMGKVRQRGKAGNSKQRQLSEALKALQPYQCWSECWSQPSRCIEKVWLKAAGRLTYNHLLKFFQNKRNFYNDSKIIQKVS